MISQKLHHITKVVLNLHGNRQLEKQTVPYFLDLAIIRINNKQYEPSHEDMVTNNFSNHLTSHKIAFSEE